jgi:hypothetical protein
MTPAESPSAEKPHRVTGVAGKLMTFIVRIFVDGRPGAPVCPRVTRT